MHARVFPGVGGARGDRLALAALRALRPVGAPPRWQRTATVLPATLLKRLRAAEDVYAAAGSLAEAARVLDVPVQQLRRRLELARAVRTLPSVRPIDCPGAGGR